LVDKTSNKSRCFAFVTVEDLIGEVKDKIMARKHEINGKIVDVKLAVEGKEREKMLDSSKKVFVGGLDPSVTNNDLRNFFTSFGEVREAVVVFDNNRGISRCFGFVTFEDKDAVELLLRQNNYQIKGKLIDVKQALPKSMQKQQNVISQSGIDVLLNPKPKPLRDIRTNFCDDETEDLDDGDFVDYITSPSNKGDTPKHRENSKTTMNMNNYYNFNNMFPMYDLYARKEHFYGPSKPIKMNKPIFKPY